MLVITQCNAGGNAEKSGKVQVGDVLSRCSATVLKSGKEGEFEAEDYGKRPYDNWETASGVAPVRASAQQSD
jgi:hypothetical protein